MKLSFSWKHYWFVWGLIGHITVAVGGLSLLYMYRQPIISVVKDYQRGDADVQLSIVDIQNHWQQSQSTYLVTPEVKQRVISINDESDLKKAIRSAVPGDLLELSDGVYDFKGRSLAITQPGLVDAPITIMAKNPWGAKLRLNMLEGFWVNAPYWQFSGLSIEGACSKDSRCEHAFHIVGEGMGTKIVANRISSFNSPVKINGSRGNFPDRGVIQGNSFVNPKPRKTSRPVTFIDAVAVSNWQIKNNLIANFKKQGGDRTSYGGFFKGAGEDNLFQHNLVVCSDRPTNRFVQVGLSMGGGGTMKSACRDKTCSAEQSSGRFMGNLIANCSDVGIYLNRSEGTLLANNTLYNTLGLDVRFPQSDAVIVNNLLSGRIKERNGGDIRLESNNWILPISSRFSKDFDSEFLAPRDLDFSAVDGVDYPEGIENLELDRDFCGNAKEAGGFYVGAISIHQFASCLQTKSLPKL